MEHLHAEQCSAAQLKTRQKSKKNTTEIGVFMDIKMLAERFYNYSLQIRGFSKKTVCRYKSIVDPYCLSTTAIYKELLGCIFNK